MGKLTAAIRLADEVWIATALLHREHPGALDFSLDEIVDRLRREGIEERPGVYPHVSLHCVANRPPKPARYRMLFETARSRRRLFRPGDPYHPKRERGKIVPDRTQSRPGTNPCWTGTSATGRRRQLAIRCWLWLHATPASGKTWILDDYVRQLREGFE